VTKMSSVLRLQTSAPDEDILVRRPYLVNDLVDPDQFFISLQVEGKMAIIPSCICGARKGGVHRGEVCELCNSEVEPMFSKPGVLYYYKQYNDLRYMSPVFIDRINKAIGKRSFEIFTTKPQDTMITSEREGSSPEETNSKETVDQQFFMGFDGFERSYRFFVENFEALMLRFASVSKKKALVMELLDIWRNDYESVMWENIYLPSRDLIITEVRGSTKYTDSSGQYQILELLKKGILYNKSNKKTPASTDKLVGELVLGQYNAVKNVILLLEGKKGEIRWEINSTRASFSARTIIGSISGGSKFWEIHMPYVMAVASFRPMIIGWLVEKKSMSLKKATQRYLKAEISLDEEIADFLDTIIERRKVINGCGYPVLVHRNPTLERATMQLLYCNKIKRNIKDTTFSVSSLMISPILGDFDGDNINLHFAHDLFTEKVFSPFKLYYSILDNSKAHRINPGFTISKPAVSLYATYLNHKDPEDEIDSVSNEFLTEYRRLEKEYG